MVTESLSVLVVDDEAALREVLTVRLGGWGYNVTTAADADEAAAVLERQAPDVVLSDVVLPGASGLELLQRVRENAPGLPVVMITAHRNVDAAVEAMKGGAMDFLTKPLDYTNLHALLESVAADLRQGREDRTLDRLLREGRGPGGLVGRSRPMRDLYRMIELVASSDASAIITGESGTGKEVVASTIHALSQRCKGPFVPVNAAAIPEGLIESEVFGHERGAFTGATQARAGCFEQANGGTLFLDEIAEMPMALQPKLLRILEDGRARRLGGSREIQFDVRVLAATNRDPAEAVRSRLLREDLLYRLKVFELTLPPLRDRPEDIPLLAQHFVHEFSRKHGVDVKGVRDTARSLLEASAWRGNVRELRNVLERAVIVARSGWIEPQHLPPHLRALEAGGSGTLQLPSDATMADAERALILHTLERVGQNKAEAARRLGVDVKTIRNKLKRYSGDADE